MCGKILKYDEDPDCEACGESIPDGKQYGCEYCGEDFCEPCMEQEADGMGFSGYRGQIDSGHPIENHPAFTGGAYCAECASDMVSDGSLDDEGNPIPDEDDEEPPVPQSPFEDLDERQLAERIGSMDHDRDFLAELVEEAARRTMRGDTQQRTDMTAQMEGVLNSKLREMGQPPKVVKPPGDKLPFGYPEGFDDKFASADTFTSVWDVLKHGRI